MTRYYTITYTDNRNNIRTTKYFKDKGQRSTFVLQNQVYMVDERYGRKEM